MHALQQAIDALLERMDIRKLRQASQQITERYREGGTLTDEEELLAYLVVRVPATYASLCAVLKNIAEPGSILDLGAGPGTVFWAAQEVWGRAPLITAIEREGPFIELGKRLGSQVTWKQGDLLAIPSFEPHEWVTFSYSLGELPESERGPLLEQCWQAAHQGVIIIEPGTPRGNHTMLQARSHLVGLGGVVWAPCPHSNPCPMVSPEWCHFSARLERSPYHRLAKMACLSYEDEKFSYVIVSKTPRQAPLSRLIHSPLHRSGHTILPLCTPTGLHNITLSRRDKELYKKARKAHWGDLFNLEF